MLPLPPVPRLVGVAALTAGGSTLDRLLRTPPLPASLTCRCRRSSSSSRFSNAEPVEDAARARRRWWSDSDAERDPDYDVDDGYDDDGGGFGGGVFDEPWFSKVFRMYGFVLPVVLASMFLATGPKAFLMAMAIPLGQSAISFVLDAIWGTRGRRGNQRTVFEEYEYDDNDDFEAQENWGENKTYSYYNRARESSYQRSAESDDADHSSTSSNRDQSGGSSTGSRFGGWDELDLDSNIYNSERSPQPPPRTPMADDAALRRGGGSRQRMSARRMTNRYKQAPLFMRLLVAVFPFLGSWFRIL